MIPQASSDFDAGSGQDKKALASRRRIRDFISSGTHPESLTEQNLALKPKLRNGDPFPFVVAVIPAYNEEVSILRTIKSLREQTRRPDEIIVLADNCTDSTVALSLAAGVSVVESVGNVDGKAGALNAFLAEILPKLEGDDSILVMDADTVLTEKFIESTVTVLFSGSRKPIAGVGGIFLADDAEWNLVRQLQSNEYVRYQRRLSRRKGRALVLTGTGTVFKASILLEVQEARKSGRLPDLGKTQSVYDTSALTEDNELTLSVKELGYRVISPKDCTVKTAMMPNLRSLFKQRRRWQRGALENLLAHGLNKHTLPYALRQFLTHLGVLFMPFYAYTLLVALITKSSVDFLKPIWIAVMVLFVFEQTFSVRKGGKKAVIVSLAILPELFLNIFLNVVYVLSYFGTLFATDEVWGRIRDLSKTEFDKNGKSTGGIIKIAAESLHGTHRMRQTARARGVEIIVLTFTMVVLFSAVIIPLLSLQLAWNIIAIYVLIGFAATIGRLIPVRTS